MSPVEDPPAVMAQPARDVGRFALRVGFWFIALFATAGALLMSGGSLEPFRYMGF